MKLSLTCHNLADIQNLIQDHIEGHILLSKPAQVQVQAQACEISPLEIRQVKRRSNFDQPLPCNADQFAAQGNDWGVAKEPPRDPDRVIRKKTHPDGFVEWLLVDDEPEWGGIIERPCDKPFFE